MLKVSKRLTLENFTDIEPSPEETTFETMATLLGCGIDPEKSVIFA